MATVTGLTAARMLEIEANSVVSGEVDGDDLILIKFDGTEFNAGDVRGPTGATGVTSATVCTRSTRPGSPTQGQFIYETDSKFVHMWNGSAWVYMSGVFLCTAATMPNALDLFTGLEVFQTDTGNKYRWTGAAWRWVNAHELRHGCRLRNSTGAPSLTNSAMTILSFDTEDFDTDAFHSTVTNTQRITVPSGFAGIYTVTAYFNWGNTTSGTTCLMNILKNGTDALTRMDGKNAAFTGISSAWTGYLADGDYVTMGVYHTFGSTLNIAANAGSYPTDPPSPVLEAWRVGGRS